MSTTFSFSFLFPNAVNIILIVESILILQKLGQYQLKLCSVYDNISIEITCSVWATSNSGLPQYNPVRIIGKKESASTFKLQK